MVDMLDGMFVMCRIQQFTPFYSLLDFSTLAENPIHFMEEVKWYLRVGHIMSSPTNKCFRHDLEWRSRTTDSNTRPKWTTRHYTNRLDKEIQELKSMKRKSEAPLDTPKSKRSVSVNVIQCHTHGFKNYQTLCRPVYTHFIPHLMMKSNIMLMNGKLDPMLFCTFSYVIYVRINSSHNKTVTERLVKDVSSGGSTRIMLI